MHPLDGPRLKVQRAERQLQAYRQAEQAFVKKAQYKIVKAEFNPKTGKNVYRVRESVPPPLEWGAWLGEIAHDLRSALDGLAWQLALLNPGEPFEYTGFPICIVGRGKTKVIGGRRYGPFWRRDKRAPLQSVDRHLWTRIEAFQPYKRGNGGRHSPLFLLHELNNTDKHRLIQVVGIKSGVFSWSGLGDDVEHPSFATSRPVVLKDGAKFCELSPRATMLSDLIPLIAFSEGCPAVKNRTVHLTLRRILERVSEIVESFEPEFA
jgi:hypothetical protein